MNAKKKNWMVKSNIQRRWTERYVHVGRIVLDLICCGKLLLPQNIQYEELQLTDSLTNINWASNLLVVTAMKAEVNSIDTTLYLWILFSLDYK